MSLLGRFPLEVYDSILQQLIPDDWGNNEPVWLQQDILNWAAVCRTFRQSVPKYISQTLKINSSWGPDHDYFCLCSLGRAAFGPNPIFDPKYTKKIVSLDNRMDGMYDSGWTDTMIYDSITSHVYGDSYRHLLSSKPKADANLSDVEVEQSFRNAIKLLCKLFSRMSDVEEIEWGATIPLTDTYEGIMPLSGSIPGSKTILAEWLKMKKLKVLKLHDKMVTGIQLESLEICSRVYGGLIDIQGLAAVGVSEEAKKEFQHFVEVEYDMMPHHLCFLLSRSKHLKDFLTDQLDPLLDRHCIPYWATLDVDVLYWDLFVDDQYEPTAEERDGIPIARAARALKPELLKAAKGRDEITLYDLDRVFKTHIMEPFDGKDKEVDLFKPFREWVNENKRLAEQTVENFNFYLQKQKGDQEAI